VRLRAPDTLVDAALHAIADAGSIPAVSTPALGRRGVRRCAAAVAQRDQQVAQLGPLVVAQAGEDGVLGLSLGFGGAVEVALARRGQRDDVPPAVGRVARVRAREPPASSGLSSVTRMLGSVAIAWPSSR